MSKKHNREVLTNVKPYPTSFAPKSSEESSTKRQHLGVDISSEAPTTTSELEDEEDHVNNNEEEEEAMKWLNIEDDINSKIQQGISLNKGQVQGPLDPIFGQRRAFPISIDVSTLDRSTIPEDAETYLAMVRLEAQMLDEEAISNQRGAAMPNVDRLLGDEQHENLEEIGEAEDDKQLEVEADNAVPTTDTVHDKDAAWRDEFIEFFINERKEFEMYLEENKGEISEKKKSIELPDTAYTWKQFILNNEPTPELLVVILERQMHIKIIIYFTKWLTTNIDEGENSNFLQWIFQLFIAFPEVLIGSEVSLLRSMAQKATKLHQKMGVTGDKNKEKTGEILLQIVAIVAVFFRQRDLLPLDDRRT